MSRGGLNLASLFGVALALMMLVQVMAEGAASATQFSSLAVLVAGFLVAFRYPPTHEVPSLAVALLLALVVIVATGAVQSEPILGGAVLPRAGGIIAYIALGFVLARRSGHRILEQAMVAYAVTMLFVLVHVLLGDHRIFARLAGHLHPNLWGFIAATVAIILIFARIPVLPRGAAIAFIFYLLAFEFQTRGALIWAGVAVIAFGAARGYSYIRASRLARQLVPFAVIAAVPLLFLVESAVDYLLDEVLEIASATRGVNSGLTGRAEIWGLYLENFLDRPFFGHGLDMSRHFAENRFGGLVAGDISSAHSSYVTILFDFGILGFAVYLALVGLALIAALASRNMIGLAFLCLFLLMGVTESRPLNVGNPPSILFILLLAYLPAAMAPARDRSRVPPPPRRNAARDVPARPTGRLTTPSPP